MLVTDRSVACREECYTQCTLRNVTLNKCESLLSPIFLSFSFRFCPIVASRSIKFFISETHFGLFWQCCSRSRLSPVIICGDLKERAETS